MLLYKAQQNNAIALRKDILLLFTAVLLHCKHDKIWKIVLIFRLESITNNKYFSNWVSKYRQQRTWNTRNRRVINNSASDETVIRRLN